MLLRLVSTAGGLEARFSLGLVPFVAEIMQNHHGYIMLGSKFRVS